MNLKKLLQNNNAGFTLVELLVVISLLAISVGVTGDVVITLVRSFNKSQVANELEQQSNYLGLKLEKELRNAESITLPAKMSAGANLSGTNTVLGFRYKNPTTQSISYVCYRVSSGVVARSEDTTVGASSCSNSYVNLTSNDAVGGVSVTCGTTSGCFWNIPTGTSVDVTKIDLVFAQPTSGVGPSVTGTVSLRNTIVARGSY